MVGAESPTVVGGSSVRGQLPRETGQTVQPFLCWWLCRGVSVPRGRLGEEALCQTVGDRGGVVTRSQSGSWGTEISRTLQKAAKFSGYHSTADLPWCFAVRLKGKPQR